MPNTTANFSLSLQINNVIAEGSGGSPSFAVAKQLIAGFSSLGSAAGQFNSSYYKDRTVTSGTPDVLNLTTGLTQNDQITVATFADILLLAIFNNSVTPGQILNVFGGTDPVSTILGGTTPVLNIPPGMFAIVGGAVAAGYGITASTADRITVNVAAGTAVSYTIAIIGH